MTSRSTNEEIEQAKADALWWDRFTGWLRDLSISALLLLWAILFLHVVVRCAGGCP